MKVLITSGGTKIPIDSVRHIGNMSSGTFGSKILDSFNRNLSKQDSANEIYFLGAVDSKVPWAGRVGRKPEIRSGKHFSLNVIPYVTYDDYAKELERLCKEIQPDIIVLSAAVSDYGVENPVKGKIRSSEAEMFIPLKKLPKLIGFVRDWCPDAMICGFKLLVDSKDDELHDACKCQLIDNRIDMVVGNDLRDIRQDNHTLHIGRMLDGEFAMTTYQKDEGLQFGDTLADKVFNHCMFLRGSK